MATTKFSKGTGGINAQLFVSKPINETAQTTYAAFIANAAVGEIGIFNSSTLAKITAAVTAGTTFFVAQKLTGQTRRSIDFVFNNLGTSRKVVYTAPVKCKSFIGWNGTSGALNLAAAPTADKYYEMAVIDVTEGNEPFPVFNYGYTAIAGDAEIDVIQALVKQINDYNSLLYKTLKPIVSAKAKANATYSNYTLTGTTPTATFTNGSTLVTLGGTTPSLNAVIGDYLSVDAAATPDASIGDIYKVVGTSAGVSITLNRPYQGATQTFTQAEVQGTRIKKAATFVATGIELNGLNNFEFFKLAARNELINATRINTAFTKGSGSYDQVNEQEEIGNTFQGNTTINTAFNTKFGLMDRFATVGETYDYYHLDFDQRANPINTFANGTKREHLIFAAARSAGTFRTYLNTLFNL